MLVSPRPRQEAAAPTGSNYAIQMEPLSASPFQSKSFNIQQTIERVGQNVQELDRLYKAALTEANPSQAQYLHRQIDDMTQATDDLIQSARSDIKQLKGMIVPGPEAARQREFYKSLIGRIQQAARSYQLVKDRAQKDIRAQAERQYRVVRPQATQDEINRFIDNPQGNAFAQEMSGLGQQRRMLEDAQSRHSELVKIQRSIEELVRLFEEMQFLLQEQGEIITNIETHVDKAADHINNGTTEMSRAITNAQSARKTKWIILIVILVVLIAVALFVYFQFFHKN
ncbi:t-SNARE [Polychytrium aggregatum]|uniref:t-SNARE n=1 Tax=Polychytrium aggregatum TaxID=110093 RepID=UPI0022FF4528|nr:t-SNARE [Polychytrium aggregatum]KAI9202356.1 t-SNARE [Polychytrium aggregatum]